jgi:hypothetical protein
MLNVSDESLSSTEEPGTTSGTWTGWAMSSISSKFYKGGSASGDVPEKETTSAPQPQHVKSKCREQRVDISIYSLRTDIHCFTILGNLLRSRWESR